MTGLFKRLSLGKLAITKNTKYVGLLSFGHLANDLSQGAIPALLPFLIIQHELTYTAAAGIVFALNMAATVTQPLFGHAADRTSRTWLLPMGVTLSGLGIAVIGILPDYWMIMACALISGLGVAAYHPEAAKLVNYASDEKKGTAMSIFGVGGTLGFALGPVVGTAVVLQWNLIGTLALMVPIGLMAILLAANLPALSNIEQTQKAIHRSKGGELLPDAWGPFWRLTVVVVGRAILFFGLNTFVPLYWINVLGQSKATGATALSIMAFSGVIGNLVGGRLADRFGHIKIIILAYLLLTPLIPTLIWIETPGLAMILLSPIGFTLSLTYSPIIVTGHRYLPNHVAFASGVTIGVAMAIGGLAAPILGQVADHFGIWMALASIAFLPILFAGISATLPDPEKAKG